MNAKTIGAICAGLFVATVYLANWAIDTWGPVPVWWNLDGEAVLYAPAGVYFAGLAFTLRDVIHHTLGREAVLLAIAAGALLSTLITPQFALASGVAFLASELADLCVYEPLRARGWLPAVVASNLVGAAVDSALFLSIAFGSMEFFWGQYVAKVCMTGAAVVVLAIARRYGRLALA